MRITIQVLLLLTFLTAAFTYSVSERDDSPKRITDTEAAGEQQIITFLTFQKEDAEQAMKFYISLFDNSEVVSLDRWGAGAPGKEGTIMQATFTLNGRMYMCSDSPPIHDWDFTPAVSNYVECASTEEMEELFTRLADKGEVFMPLNNYGFSEKFGWVVDQFGVSWQLNFN